MTELRNSPEREMALIGCLVVGGMDVWPKVRSVPVEAFFWPSHRTLWAACRRMCEVGKSPELLALKDAGQDFQLAYECCEAMVHVKQAAQFAEDVLELWTVRQYREYAATLAKQCDDPQTDPRDIGRGVMDAVKSIEAGRPPVVRATRIGDVLGTLGEKAEPGLATGIACFDESNAHHGLAPGEPTFVGAMTGVGKTVLGVQIAANVAERGGNVLFGTFELAAKTITRRFVQYIGGYRSRYEADMCREAHLYDDADRRVGFWSMEIYDPAVMGPASSTVEAFCDYAERCHDGVPWDLVVIDYAQLLQSKKRFPTDVARQENTAHEIRMLAKRTGCPVLVLAQAQKDALDKGRLRLRNSREFENVANAIVLIDQTREDGKDATWLVVDKNRDGRRVKQRVLRKSPWGRFEPCGQDTDHVYRGGE